MKRKIFALYPYYYPHYKAGGPVQSLYNLAGHFTNVEFFFISLCKDIDNSASNIPPVSDLWQKGPQGENIFYASSFSFNLIRKLMAEINPDIVFVNGLFNVSTTFPGVFWAKWYGAKLIISPRGMLQPWALKQRRLLLKKIFIRLLKVMVGREAVWHATDELERTDIISAFGKDQVVHVASNIPRQVSKPAILNLPKGNDKIKLVFLSLINPNKNLHLIIDALTDLGHQFSLDIYGPIADTGYWEFCKSKVAKNSAVTYRGGVLPWEVPAVLQQYHFFVLPTVGENFGHAIFDSLSSGVPVLISRTTPWQDIEEKNAGYYIDPLDITTLFLVLKKVSGMSPEQYQQCRMQSHAYALRYWETSTFNKDYQFLIGHA